MSMKTLNKNANKLDRETLTELMDYDPNTGIFTWKVSRGPVKAGDRAGTMFKNGYRYIFINYQRHREARVVWLYMTGEWPSLWIDHKDHNKSNNSWDNLRLATPAQSGVNRILKKKSNMPIGVVDTKRGKKRYTAEISIKGAKKRLGHFYTPEDAHEAYKKAVAEIHGEEFIAHL